MEEGGLLLPKEERKINGRSTNYRRLVTGVIVLIFVDILWVASAELSDFIFHNEGFDKPFFTTYFKTASFALYLPWVWLKSLYEKHYLNVKTTSSNQHETSESFPYSVNTDEDCENEDMYCEHPKYVQNDNPELERYPPIPKHPVDFVMKVAVIFGFLWFLATLLYQEALAVTSPAAVNILSSSSGLFTLILAAIFQSSHNDRFSLSKLVAVLLSITGIVLVTLSDSHQTKGGINYGAFYSLGGAIMYSCYLVLLKLKVPNESQMNIAMFFGFVGLFCTLFLWPGFWIFHAADIEKFELPPDWITWFSLIMNAIFGTVFSEYLWLWGCYLTSSLSATLALGMVMPLTMLIDILRGRVELSFMFVCGSVPIFLSFFAITCLCHYQDWDPVKTGVLRVYNCIKMH